MADFPEINLLLARVYRYEAELLGGSSKQSELDVLKQAITETIRAVKQAVNERNEMRSKKEKFSTSKMIRLTAQVKEDIESLERMVRDFETMLSSRKVANPDQAAHILSNFNAIIAKLKENEADSTGLGAPTADKFANVDMSCLTSDSSQPEWRRPRPQPKGE
jgi:predicted phage tail protein